MPPTPSSNVGRTSPKSSRWSSRWALAMSAAVEAWVVGASWVGAAFGCTSAAPLAVVKAPSPGGTRRFDSGEPALNPQGGLHEVPPVRALLVVAVLLLAGCSSEPPPVEADLHLVTPADAEDADAARLQLRLLADVNRSYTNPTPPPSPESGGNEWVLAEVELEAGHHNLSFEFARSHVSFNFWEPTCRVYQGDLLLAEDAFSDAGLGQTISSGTCHLH